MISRIKILPLAAASFALFAVLPAFAQPADPAAPAAAPDTVLPGRPDAPVSDALDPAFTSTGGGISVRPPPGGKMQRRAGTGDELVRFVDEKNNWTMVVSRINLSEPVSLAAPQDRTKGSGFADEMAAQMPSETPGKLIRTDLQPINGYEGALLASRFTDNGIGRLMQQAIVRRTDKQYYVITYSTALTQADLETDPAALKAMETFTKIVDSITLIDQQQITDDQNERLVRSRALMVNWTPERLHKVLVPEQWLRLMKDGKDIGYTYIVEEEAGDLPRKLNKSEEKVKDLGVRVGVRWRGSVPMDGTAVDAESWMWVQNDRKREVFHNQLVSTERGKEKDFTYAMDAGMSIQPDRVVPVMEERPEGAIGRQDPVAAFAPYTLKVVSTSKKQSLPPVDRKLPPYYLPQALVHLMPRLLPLNEARTYMFASYVPETRQVMTRYVDVKPIRKVTLGGKDYTAVPVDEKAGLEGSTTTHFLTTDGKYLGSVNEDNHITILATDEKSLRAIWKDAKFERPGEVDEEKK